jgi:hypothetical protein
MVLPASAGMGHRPAGPESVGGAGTSQIGGQVLVETVPLIASRYTRQRRCTCSSLSHEREETMTSFPIRHRTRQKRWFGYQTGDLVRALIKSGTHAGKHTGRLTLRARKSFRVNGIDVHPKYLTKSECQKDYNIAGFDALSVMPASRQCDFFCSKMGCLKRLFERDKQHALFGERSEAALPLVKERDTRRADRCRTRKRPDEYWQRKPGWEREQ